MTSLSSLKFLLLLIPCILVQGFPQPNESPAETTDIDPILDALLQDEPGEIVAELDNQNNDDPVYQDESNDVPDKEPETNQNDDDDASKGEYKPEENLGKTNMLEGDINLDKSTQDIMDNLKSDARDAVTNPVKHWPGGRVPYSFGYVSSKVKSAFKQAIREYKRHTCIKIVPKTRRDRDYIYVVSEGGCWSAIGRSRGRQKLSLGRGCEWKGTAIHELMHALGFFHEQSRRDRDRYISIQWSNILQGMRYNFEKYRHGQADTLNAPYDYGSVMHYPEYAFSSNRRKTIIPKQSAARIGQRKTFSKIDIQQINKLYKCSGGGGGGGGQVTRPPVRPPTTRPPTGICKDKYTASNHCPNWSKLGFCSRSHRYGDWMKLNCKKSCGFCRGRPVIPTKPPCRDYKSGCSGWGRYCRYWNRYYSFMMKNCKRTCRKC